MVNNDDLLNLCTNIRLTRAKYRLTKEEMAKIMGVSVRTVSRLEHGEVPPRFNAAHLVRFCNHFNILPSTLFLKP